MRKLQCPRCASPNTRFCGHNRRGRKDPKYFCNGCHRYWIDGGRCRVHRRWSRRSRACLPPDEFWAEEIVSVPDDDEGSRASPPAPPPTYPVAVTTKVEDEERMDGVESMNESTVESGSCSTHGCDQPEKIRGFRDTSGGTDPEWKNLMTFLDWVASELDNPMWLLDCHGDCRQGQEEERWLQVPEEFRHFMMKSDASSSIGNVP